MGPNKKESQEVAKIEVTAYLNKIKHTQYGTIFEIGERHSKKNQTTGEWEQDGTNTYYDVWVDRSGADASLFNESDLIVVEGSFRTKKTEKEGKTYYNNVINATSLRPFERRERSEQSVQIPDNWVESDAPF